MAGGGTPAGAGGFETGKLHRRRFVPNRQGDWGHGGRRRIGNGGSGGDDWIGGAEAGCENYDPVTLLHGPRPLLEEWRRAVEATTDPIEGIERGIDRRDGD